jgi:hypothetical protein
MTAATTEQVPLTEAPAPLTPTGHIRQAIVTLAACRRLADEAAAAAEAVKAKFVAENVDVLGRASVTKIAVEQAEAQVKALAGAYFASIPKENPEARETAKRPAPGVLIKLGEKLVYDAARAFTWAKEKQMALVPESLDVAAFEKIAGATKIDFVTTAEAPKVTISTDLDKALAAEVAP